MQIQHQLCFRRQSNYQTETPSMESERELNGKIPYVSVVGNIMYAMVATRCDLAHVVGVGSRYMSNPRRKHWDAVKHILRYLRGTKDGQLTFRSTNPTEFKGYTDSDYVKNAENRNSTSCYIFTFGGGTTVSTTKAKYIAASDAAKESIWLHRLLADFLVTRWLNHPTPTIHYNSQSTIHLIRNSVYHVKMKHIEVRFHHIRELVIEKKLEVRKIDTEVNITDCLTKPLPDQRFGALRTKLVLRQATEQSRAEHGTRG